MRWRLFELVLLRLKEIKGVYDESTRSLGCSSRVEVCSVSEDPGLEGYVLDFKEVKGNSYGEPDVVDVYSVSVRRKREGE